MKPEAEVRSAEDPATSARRGAWPLGVLGMLAIVAATERFIGSQHDAFDPVTAIEWRWAGRALRREAKDSRVLCFGSSITRMGVSPKILEEKLGMPAYSFASSGAQPYANYAALRQALASGSKPEAVVVDFTWSVLGLPYYWNEHVLPEQASLADCAELAITARDPDFLGRICLGWMLPSYRCRYEVRANVRAGIDGTEGSERKSRLRPGITRNIRINRGSSHAVPSGGNFPVDLADSTTFPKDWNCDPISEYYIHKFFELAESRGIPVFWWLTPISPAALQHRTATGLEDRYTKFVERVAARHRGLTVIDGRGARYATEAFVDMVHLSRDGAVALTDDLAEIIRGRLGRGVADGSRWVGLPRYRPDPLASRVEDIGHSAALAEQLRVRGLFR